MNFLILRKHFHSRDLSEASPQMLVNAAQSLSVRSLWRRVGGSWQGGTRLRCSGDNSSLPCVTEMEKNHLNYLTPVKYSCK